MPYLTYHDGEETQRFEITRKLTGVGRAADNDLCLSDSAVQAYHAQILKDGKNFVLSSLDRAAVLVVNGKDRRNYSLKDGDLLMFGGTELTFSLEEPHGEDAAVISGRHASPTSTPLRVAVPGAVDPRLEKIATFAGKLLLGMQVPEVFKTLLDSVIELCGANKGFLIHLQ
ncbi:MAG TPA: hypothetical protein DIU15_08740, partial [Deltaproteobacteria bacterium]|nr:hypothetical protein [Deltaproteobacteria bacterium]